MPVDFGPTVLIKEPLVGDTDKNFDGEGERGEVGDTIGVVGVLDGDKIGTGTENVGRGVAIGIADGASDDDKYLIVHLT
jgi:hypothetical protein